MVVIRDGFQIAGAGTLKMSEGLPEDDRNDSTRQRYACNILRVVPQLRYSLDNENAIDLVFFINGIPVATVAIGNGTNAGLLAAQILALADGALAERLAAYRSGLHAQVRAKDERLQSLGSTAYLAAMGVPG